MVAVLERLIPRLTWMPSGCIECSGALGAGYYPRIGVGGRKADYVHRVAYVLLHGKQIPAGYEVDHVCGNTRCVAHLEAVTQAENKRRARERALAARDGRCPEGHEYRGRRPNGQRRCLDCEKGWRRVA